MTERPTRLSVGVLSGNLARLAEELAILDGSDSWAHVDVMDGDFVPQLTVGPAFLRAVAATGVPVDAHLMVTEPRRFLEPVVAVDPALVTVHVESTRHLYRTFVELTELAGDRRLLRGVAVNPGTPVGAIEPVLDLVDLVLVLAVEPGWPNQEPAPRTAERIAAARELTAGSDRPVLVGVDGGVTLSNLTEVVAWQPDLIVSGSAVFGAGDASRNLDRIRRALAAPEADLEPAARNGRVL
ncbi:hypothetical protein PWY87_21265 [Kribbella solani]|uniref:ribulose-phosphate 3-epimerase n=1 Tax=Kribbella solani TaxID=236067 RepID=UPI0029BCA76B|nr:hypothetical protein [Kribbella solani]MDX2970134.1 hypothetical protein [Kribbella solani]MDX3004233.1 hypothetical protein [Kribbella solani]